MNVATIKTLAQEFDSTILMKAEEELLHEQKPSINVPGEDEGEQLTHVIGALWIQREMSTHAISITTAVRHYTRMVRSTIE